MQISTTSSLASSDFVIHLYVCYQNTISNPIKYFFIKYVHKHIKTTLTYYTQFQFMCCAAPKP